MGKRFVFWYFDWFCAKTAQKRSIGMQST